MLDRNVYEDVEADRGANWQALIVVLASSLAGGIGTFSAYRFEPQRLVLATLVALVVWIAWASLTSMIGTHLLPEPQTRADAGELLRTLGFASAPGLIQVAGLIDPLRRVFLTVGWLWMLAAMIVAVRQALDYKSTLRAIAVCAVGLLISVGMAVIVGLALTRTVS